MKEYINAPIHFELKASWTSSRYIVRAYLNKCAIEGKENIDLMVANKLHLILSFLNQAARRLEIKKKFHNHLEKNTEKLQLQKDCC